MNGKLRVCRKCLPGQKNEEAFYEDLSRYIQRMDEELKVDQQRNGIHNGGDKRRGHHCRVKANFLSQQRQCTPHQLGAKNRADHGGADHCCHRNGDKLVVEQQPVHQHQLDKIRC